MNRVHALASISLAIAAQQAPNSKPSSDWILHRTLANGLAVSVVPDADETKRVFASFSVRGGSLDDPDDQEGLAEVLCASLVEGGSQMTNGADLATWLESHHASIAAAAEPRRVKLDLVCGTGDLPELLSRAAELIHAPAYPESLIAERRSDLADTPEDGEEGLPRSLDRLAFGRKERVGRTPTQASALSIARDALLEWHQRHFVTTNVELGLCGAVNESTFAIVERTFGDWPKAESAPIAAPPKVPANNGHVVFLAASDSASLTLVGAGPADGDPDAAAAGLLRAAMRSALGLDSAGAQARTDAGLEQAPEFWFETSPWGYGAFRAHAEIRADRAREALAAVRAMLSKDALAKLPKAAIDDALRSQAGTPTVASARARMEQWLAHTADSGRIAAPFGAADLANAVSKFVAPDSTWVLVTGPLATLEKAFAGDDRVQVLDTTRSIASTLAGLARRDQMFRALGGAERWAKLRTLRTEGTVVQGATEITASSKRDLATQRLWQSQVLNGKTSVSVLTPNELLLRREADVSVVDRAAHALALRRSECHIVQMLHDLAINRARGVRLASDGMLEVLYPSGVLCWIELAEDGKPKSLGWQPEGVNEGGLFRFEDWREAQGYAYPAKITQPEKNLISTTNTIEFDANFDAATFELGRAK